MPHQKKERITAISKDLINSQSFVNLPPKQKIKIAKPKYIQNQQQKQQSTQNVSDVQQRKQAVKLNQSKNSTDILPKQNESITQQQSHERQHHHVTQSKGNSSSNDVTRSHINKCISDKMNADKSDDDNGKSSDTSDSDDDSDSSSSSSSSSTEESEKKEMPPSSPATTQFSVTRSDSSSGLRMKIAAIASAPSTNGKTINNNNNNNKNHIDGTKNGKEPKVHNINYSGSQHHKRNESTSSCSTCSDSDSDSSSGTLNKHRTRKKTLKNKRANAKNDEMSSSVASGTDTSDDDDDDDEDDDEDDDDDDDGDDDSSIDSDENSVRSNPPQAKQKSASNSSHKLNAISRANKSEILGADGASSSDMELPAALVSAAIRLVESCSDGENSKTGSSATQYTSSLLREFMVKTQMIGASMNNFSALANSSKATSAASNETKSTNHSKSTEVKQATKKQNKQDLPASSSTDQNSFKKKRGRPRKLSALHVDIASTKTSESPDSGIISTPHSPVPKNLINKKSNRMNTPNKRTKSTKSQDESSNEKSQTAATVVKSDVASLERATYATERVLYPPRRKKRDTHKMPKKEDSMDPAWRKIDINKKFRRPSISGYKSDGGTTVCSKVLAAKSGYISDYSNVNHRVLSGYKSDYSCKSRRSGYKSDFSVRSRNCGYRSDCSTRHRRKIRRKRRTKTALSKSTVNDQDILQLAGLTLGQSEDSSEESTKDEILPFSAVGSPPKRTYFYKKIFSGPVVPVRSTQSASSSGKEILSNLCERVTQRLSGLDRSNLGNSVNMGFTNLYKENSLSSFKLNNDKPGQIRRRRSSAVSHCSSRCSSSSRHPFRKRRRKRLKSRTRTDNAIEPNSNKLNMQIEMLVNSFNNQCSIIVDETKDKEKEKEKEKGAAATKPHAPKRIVKKKKTSETTEVPPTVAVAPATTAATAVTTTKRRHKKALQTKSPDDHKLPLKKRHYLLTPGEKSEQKATHSHTNHTAVSEKEKHKPDETVKNVLKEAPNKAITPKKRHLLATPPAEIDPPISSDSVKPTESTVKTITSNSSLIETLSSKANTQAKKNEMLARKKNRLEGLVSKIQPSVTVTVPIISLPNINSVAVKTTASRNSTVRSNVAEPPPGVFEPSIEDLELQIPYTTITSMITKTEIDSPRTIEPIGKNAKAESVQQQKAERVVEKLLNKTGQKVIKRKRKKPNRTGFPTIKKKKKKKTVDDNATVKSAETVKKNSTTDNAEPSTETNGLALNIAKATKSQSVVQEKRKPSIGSVFGEIDAMPSLIERNSRPRLSVVSLERLQGKTLAEIESVEQSSTKLTKEISKKAHENTQENTQSRKKVKNDASKKNEKDNRDVSSDNEPLINLTQKKSTTVSEKTSKRRPEIVTKETNKKVKTVETVANVLNDKGNKKGNRVAVVKLEIIDKNSLSSINQQNIQITNPSTRKSTFDKSSPTKISSTLAPRLRRDNVLINRPKRQRTGDELAFEQNQKKPKLLPAPQKLMENKRVESKGEKQASAKQKTPSMEKGPQIMSVPVNEDASQKEIKQKHSKKLETIADKPAATSLVSVKEVKESSKQTNKRTNQNLDPYPLPKERKPSKSDSPSKSQSSIELKQIENKKDKRLGNVKVIIEKHSDLERLSHKRTKTSVDKKAHHKAEKEQRDQPTIKKSSTETNEKTPHKSEKNQKLIENTSGQKDEKAESSKSKKKLGSKSDVSTDISKTDSTSCKSSKDIPRHVEKSKASNRSDKGSKENVSTAGETNKSSSSKKTEKTQKNSENVQIDKAKVVPTQIEKSSEYEFDPSDIKPCDEVDCLEHDPLPPINDLPCIDSASDTSQSTDSKRSLTKLRKKYLVAGLFSNYYKEDQVPTDKAGRNLKTEEPLPESLLPPPPYCEKYFRQTQQDFCLPYDLWHAHEKGTLPGRIHSWNFKKIRTNVYIDVKANPSSDQAQCSCKPGSGCADHCLNRMVYTECSPETCPCGEQCQNTKIQRHIIAPGVERFMTTHKGWGVRTKQPVKKGTYILEYVGEVVTEREFKERMATLYDRDIHHYCLHLDGGLVIDGHRMGSDCRFVNHSCAPNCEMQKWSVNGLSRMALFAMRDIQPGEELTYDYNFSLFNPAEGQTCKCETPQCRGVIGGKTQRIRPIETVPTDKEILSKNGRSGRLARPKKGGGSKSKSFMHSKDISRLTSIHLPSAKEQGLIANGHCFLLRNLRKIRRMRNTQQSSMPPASTQQNLTAQISALRVPRSIRTRGVTIAENDPILEKTLRIAGVLREICEELGNFKDTSGQCAISKLNLPSKKKCPKYYEIVKSPIDLSTIENNVEKGVYDRPVLFDADILKLFSNAIEFYGVDSSEASNVQQLQTAYATKKANVYDKLNTIVGDPNEISMFHPNHSNQFQCAPSDPDEEHIQCICGLYRDEGVMIQCSECKIWQHAECTRADIEAEHYFCEKCKPRNVDYEIPLRDKTKEGYTCYLTLMRGTDLQVRQSDTVYVLRDIPIENPDPNSKEPVKKHTYETIGDFAYSECDIFRVECLWKDHDGKRFVSGHHYLRPHETYHEPTRKFYQNEVVGVSLFEVIPIELIMGRCWVLDKTTFCKGRPVNSVESHVYICEWRVDKTARTFGKISRNKYPTCTKNYAFNKFRQKLKISRNYLPHEVNLPAVKQTKRSKAEDTVTSPARKNSTPIVQLIPPPQKTLNEKRTRLEIFLSKLMLIQKAANENMQPLDLSYLLTGRGARRRTNTITVPHKF